MTVFWCHWASSAVTVVMLLLIHSLAPPPLTRLTHDISLDEFEDDDLSEITEITDECGMSLNCNGPDVKVSGSVRSTGSDALVLMCINWAGDQIILRFFTGKVLKSGASVEKRSSRTFTIPSDLPVKPPSPPPPPLGSAAVTTATRGFGRHVFNQIRVCVCISLSGWKPVFCLPYPPRS